GMDVGTAKPTLEERARVRHHLIDVAEPGERYDVARYQRDARATLAQIRARGRAAIVVGGTGLYVRALLDGLELAALPHDPLVRARIEAEAAGAGAAAVHARLAAVDPVAASRVDPRNVRRVVRYLEVVSVAGRISDRWRRGPSVPALRIGLRPPRAWLADAIAARVRRMVADGVLDEARALVARGMARARVPRGARASALALRRRGLARGARDARRGGRRGRGRADAAAAALAGSEQLGRQGQGAGDRPRGRAPPRRARGVRRRAQAGAA